jgi:hypothetical protein
MFHRKASYQTINNINTRLMQLEWNKKDLKMNYLGIKQGSGIIFILEILFCINFTHFISLWAAATIS